MSIDLFFLNRNYIFFPKINSEIGLDVSKNQYSKNLYTLFLFNKIDKVTDECKSFIFVLKIACIFHVSLTRKKLTKKST